MKKKEKSDSENEDYSDEEQNTKIPKSLTLKQKKDVLKWKKREVNYLHLGY
jgi:hypothetical protein